MGYTSKNTLNTIQVLVRELFKSNAKADNIVYNLTTKLNFPILGDLIHQHVAHVYGKQSDKITDFLDLRNDFILRGNEIVEPKEYNSVIDCLYDLMMIQEEIENLLKDCIITASDNMDLSVEDMLRDLYKSDIVYYTKQVCKLHCVAVQYEEDGNLSLFDAECFKYLMVD